MIMQYIVLPVSAFVWLVYTRQQDHHTDIAVLKSRVDSDKQSHDREMAEIRETTNKIFAKLDSIEEALRR
jgi:hypothetical protein